MGSYKNVDRNYINSYFGINNRYSNQYKSINLFALYRQCVASTSYGEMKHHVYMVFRNKNYGEAMIDSFWTRLIRLELEREEKLREKQRIMKYIELNEIMRGRYI